MDEPSTNEHAPAPGSVPWRVALAVFVALAAAAGLFAAGLFVGDDRDASRGAAASQRMHGNRGMARSDDTLRGGGMMGGMSAMRGMSISSEREYLTEMIPHHLEAIESAKVLKAGSERAELREFADVIITTQQAEVDAMRDFLDTWHDGAKPVDDYQPMMRSGLDKLSGDELDEAFLQDMPMHHMMAVHMSRSLISNDLAEHDEVADLARSIDIVQRREMWQMHGWLRDWFDGDARPRPDMPMMGRDRR